MFGSSSESLVRSKNFKPASEQSGYPFVKTAIQENDAPRPDLIFVKKFTQRFSFYYPLPQFRQLVQLFLNAKNVDLSDIQNESLSKILLK